MHVSGHNSPHTLFYAFMWYITAWYSSAGVEIDVNTVENRVLSSLEYDMIFPKAHLLQPKYQRYSWYLIGNKEVLWCEVFYIENAMNIEAFENTIKQ